MSERKPAWFKFVVESAVFLIWLLLLLWCGAPGWAALGLSAIIVRLVRIEYATEERP